MKSPSSSFATIEGGNDQLAESRAPSQLWDCFKVFLTNTNTRVETLIATFMLMIRLGYGEYSWYDLVVVLGIVAIWPLAEWVGANIQHLKPLKLGPIVFYSRFQQVHMLHHHEPRNLKLTNAPISSLLYLAPVFALLWWALMPNWALALTAMAAQAVGVFLYEWAHFLAHTRYQPKTKYFRMMRQHHLLHHFRNPNYWYGFLTPWVDRVMGTNPHPDDVKVCR